ncbi:hypothetical protein A2853_02930 [Candidatus Kaiserbacteria bacterium RIFCSPHIGHO2_01_FULL_55_17]|uniref:Uncharacterized protein n=1 Tax=Candidatus Kaiserbacteria bacterium RIFCSPHIGHO2_01_FULL_55_17 TaxID=1798484 RepID=A0A1F6D7V2_9BACT|nr:MAG: hypothetical protein A2853_02930 [Candidatus Kaiserbacteria bacterium RIFCSPHIGHO2_01_FULL_55_17]
MKKLTRIGLWVAWIVLFGLDAYLFYAAVMFYTNLILRIAMFLIGIALLLILIFWGALWLDALLYKRKKGWYVPSVG